MDNKQILSQTELTSYAKQKKAEADNKPKSEFLTIPYLGNFKADDTPYDPLDFKEVRKRILDNAELAIKTRFPLESDKYLLTVDDVHYQNHNYTIKDEKAALRDGVSLSARLKGTWKLYDKTTGQLIDEKTTTLLNVPYMTDKGTFIRNGSEYALKSMFRLRSGVYTRIKNDGNIATHINPEQGTGRQSTINMDPATGVFTVKMGTRNYGLLPLLQAMGADPDEIEQVWGKDLFQTNYNKYRNIMTGTDTKGAAEYKELWADKYAKMKLDPETTGHTLGVPFKEINSDMFMRATGKILNIAKTYDTSLTDARDSLLFQKVMGPADYIPERIVRDGGGLTRNLFNQINRMGNLSVIQPGTYQPHVDSVFLDDKHAGYVEGASPFEALDLNGVVSRLGEGGIGDLRAAPMESRHVQNSYLGFIDPIRSTECYTADTEIFTRGGWKIVSSLTTEDEIACLIDDRLEYHNPEAINVYDYKGTLYCYKDKQIDYKVTPNHRMYVRCADRLRNGKPCNMLIRAAEDVHNKRRQVQQGGILPYIGANEHESVFKLEHVDPNLKCEQIHGNPPLGANTRNIDEIDIFDFAEYMGWYLSEGSYSINLTTGHYRADISQSRDKHPELFDHIVDLVKRLPFDAYRDKECTHKKTISISRKQLVIYLSQFGKCEDKFIPSWIFEAPIEARKRFRWSILQGDGRGQRHLTTKSKQLALDFMRLQIELGESVQLLHEQEKRYENHPGTWTVYWHKNTHVELKHPRYKKQTIDRGYSAQPYHYTEEYEGKVYCPTVPGGLVYVRRNNCHGFWCGNSLAVGLNNYLAYGAKKDSNGNLYSMFIKNGDTKPKYLKMTEAAKSIVATPEYNYKDADPNEFIPAIVKGRDIEYVRRKDVDYYLASSNRMMSVGASTIPGIGGIRSNRTLMGCLHPDTPLKVVYSPEGIQQTLKVKADDLLHVSDLHNYYLPVIINKDDIEQGIRLEAIRGVHKTEKTNCYRVSVAGKGCFVTENHKWWVSDIKGTRLLTTAQLKEGMQLPIAETPVSAEAIPDWCPIEAVYPVCTDVEYFVDIDVNDNIYALANGIFTHNSKYPLQALPLQNREAPLVQRALTLDDGTETTTERFIGSALGARFSPVDGKVISVDSDEVHIRGVDGQKYTVDLYNEYPANQKGFIHNTVQVKPGQMVKANDLVASSNYTTDDGTAALGVNLKTAFLNAPEGASFEDGIYISESAAKKLTSEQLYKTNISDDDDIEFDKNKFVNLFKTEKFTPEQLDKLDDTGIVKVGTTLEYGDPMILGVQNNPAGLHGIANRATVPYIEKWNHHYPGVVTDVTAGGKKAAVYVKTYTPMKPGDKMCYDDKTEVYTNRGWILFKDLKKNDKCLTLDYKTGETYFSEYETFYKFAHKGILYAYESKYVSLRLTSEHNHLIAMSPSSDFMKLERIKVMKGKPFYHVIGSDLSNPESFVQADDRDVPYKECWVRYDGFVYCVTIPETHTVYTRRNGKCCWSGNSNRLGAKATVAAVVPDEDMLKDANGEPFDVIQSTLGIPSRINPVQLAELQLGKIAKHTGKAEVLPDFPDFNIREYTLNKLKENGLTDTETCYDPVTGIKVNDVATGYMFQYKLKHMAESKKGARSTGDYTTEGLPLKGGEEGARRFGSMEWGAVIGHTGVESDVARDAKLIKGQRNDEFWRDVRDGKTPDKPGIPLVHKKFMAHLQAAGVHLEDRGKTVHAFGATDEDIRKLTKNRQVKAGATYDAKNLRPIQGGLFDPNIFGDQGDQWGYFELPEPVLNPLMADSIKDILGWKSSEMQEVLEGARYVNGRTGTEAVMALLDSMDLDKELRITKSLLKDKNTPVSKRSDLAKKYRALYSIDKQDKHPNDFFLTRIPILPPRFRPVSVIGNDVGIVADANFLYKKMIDAVEDFNEAKAVLPEEELMDARKTLYNSIEAVVGMKDPEDKKLQSKKVEGVLRWAFGKGSPKLGSLQFKVLGATVDVGGRNVITPDNSLGLDEVGISEENAWKMYEPFVVRKLRQKGFNMTKAVDMVLNRDKEALPVLEECLKERPILINRAPTLHKYSIMAMRPKITEGNTLRIPPAICKAFNADFDGNCVDFNTEIFLKSALDNSYFYAILMLVSDEEHEININNLKKKGLFMLTKENMIVIGDAKSNEVTYIGPIGKLPKQGEPIKDRNGADVYEMPEGVSVLSYDVKTGTPCWKAVKHLTVEQNTPVVKVVAGVHELIVSDNESLAVFDKETGLLKKVAPKDAKGLLIPSLRQDPMCCGTYGNADLGWLHGMFISDGWTDICHNVTGIAKMEDSKRDKFVNICKEQLDANLTIKKYEYTNIKTSANKLGDSCKYHIQSEQVSAHFTDINCYDYTSNVDVVTDVEKSALHKTIPFDCLHKGSEDYLWGLLSGLLDGDGSITCNTVYANPRYGAHVSTSSPFLRDGLKTLGHKLGIRVSVTTTKPRGLSNEAYTVTFSTVDLKKNLDKLCCIGAHETSVLAAWKASVENMDRNDFVPITDAEMSVVCKALRAIGENNTYTAMRKGYACRSTLLASLEKLDDCYKQSAEFKSLYARATDPYTLWVQVKSVEELDSREVFDLEVEDTKVFVVNQGLVVWDTMNYHVPVSQQAVKEAYEKMLPSRNLLDPANMRVHYKPVGEFAQGLFLGSRINAKKKPIRFNSLAEAQQALKEGLIKWDDPIDIPDAEAEKLLNKEK